MVGFEGTMDNFILRAKLEPRDSNKILMTSFESLDPTVPEAELTGLFNHTSY